MAITVDVLYADLTRETVGLGQVHTLTKSGVLGIVVSTDQESGALRNIMDIHGRDHYGLALRINGGQNYIMLYGWDDGDFVFRRTSNPHDVDARVEIDAPVGDWHVNFHGQLVSNAVWQQARQIYQNDMLFGAGD